MIRSVWSVTAVALIVALSAPARAEERTEPSGVRPTPIEVSWAADGAVTGGALVLWIGSEAMKDQLAPPSCRWCTPGSVDAKVRDAVAWADPARAATMSDLLVLAVPVGAVVYDGLAVGSARAALPDVLIIGEAVAVSGVLAQATKFVAARQRPYAVHGTLPSEGVDDHLSFYSGHTTIAFSAAASAGMLAQLRDDPSWPWVYGVGFTAAAASGYLRMAADKHWLTDVLVGAATGTAVGLTVPWLHRSQAGPPPLALAVAPGYVGVTGRF